MRPIYDHNELLEFMRCQGHSYDGKWLLVILANPHHRSLALEEIYNNYIYLDIRTEDVFFFLPGYANLMNRIDAGPLGDIPFFGAQFRKQLAFDPEAFARTVVWLESGGYQYSEQAELLFLKYQSTDGFDLEHIESFNLDALVDRGVILTAFFRECNCVVRDQMDMEELKAQYANDTPPRGRGRRDTRTRGSAQSLPSGPASIFISYRRDGGRDIARTIELALKAHGFRDIFFDYTSIEDGVFNKQILTAIDSCQDYLQLLSPGAMDRCANEEDYVAIEIRRAKSAGCHIIPIIVDGFQWPDNLPADLCFLKDIQFFRLLTDEYFDDSIDRLISRLKSEPSLGR